MPKKQKKKTKNVLVNGVPKKLPPNLQKRGNVQKKKKKQKPQHTKVYIYTHIFNINFITFHYI